MAPFVSDSCGELRRTAISLVEIEVAGIPISAGLALQLELKM